jgi:hypothetical protein
MLFLMYFARDTEVTGVIKDETVTMTIQQAYEQLEHPKKDATRKTVKIGIYKKTLKPCDACAAQKPSKRASQRLVA